MSTEQPISENNKATGLSKREEFEKKFRFHNFEFDRHTCEAWNDLGDENSGLCTLSDSALSEIGDWILKECVFKDDVRNALNGGTKICIDCSSQYQDGEGEDERCMRCGSRSIAKYFTPKQINDLLK